MTHHTTQSPQFFLTAPSACPYLEGQQERKVFTHLLGDRAPELNDLLTQGGFRRSQNIAYRPACETCRACVSVRILVDEFKPTRNMKRVLSRNSDLIGTAKAPETSTEQYSLFRAYLDRRHKSGGMSDMSVFDYSMMIEDTHVDTTVIEYRRRGPDSFITGEGDGELIAVALTDRMSDGLSMVYSFYNPEMEDRSLGTFMILDHINRARSAGLPHIYLGYWVNGSPKMSYKVRFEPQEHLGPRGWDRFVPENTR
ncbi:arginyltransferase [Aquamicrobium zhengzhouense]|uniref:Aspartate/glutamate leucyltransferase n=1 Tax=Aquamicrobium zhengzhouense TaxID=2781738 RepID=A0ABS0SAX5_9HYPH|nr:arginyltransferase [Aquamicrobium zhengzhouense]MBI1620407.1 arginyltransferase [Aquamicrobium zhengzhouense]